MVSKWDINPHARQTTLKKKKEKKKNSKKFRDKNVNNN